MTVPNRNRRTARAADAAEERSSGRGKPWLALLVFIVLAGVAAWFWLARDPGAREELTRRAEDVGTLARDVAASLSSAASSLRDRITGVRPRVDETVSTTQTLPGAPPPIGMTAPDRSNGANGVRGAYRPDGTGGTRTPDEVEKALRESIVPLEGGAVERGSLASPDETPPPEAGRVDDAVVRVGFIEDLAAWLVQGYTPADRPGRAGHLGANLQAANLRYGVGMKGLAWIGDDLPAGRAAALRHVFTPAMLDALYRMYIDRFMNAVARAAAAPGDGRAALTDAQQSEMYRLYSRRFRGMSGALQGVAALPDFTGRMDALRAAAQRVVDTGNRYSELVLAQDAARESGDPARVAEVRARVDAASRAYRQAVVDREKAKSELAVAIRTNPAARLLDDDTLLYIASWVERRVVGSPSSPDAPDVADAMDAVLQGATLFLELGKRFEEASQGPPAPAPLPAFSSSPAASASGTRASGGTSALGGVSPAEEDDAPLLPVSGADDDGPRPPAP